MKQTIEVDPALIAYRTVANAFTVATFQNGIFSATTADTAEDNLAYLQLQCEKDRPFANGSKPTDSFKIAVGQLVGLKRMPSLLASAGHDEIAEQFINSGALAYENSEQQYEDVFGPEPNRMEAFLIRQACAELDPRFLFDAHPGSDLVVPAVFSEAVPEYEEAYRTFVSNGRMARLYHYMKEYLRATDKETGAVVTVTPPQPPKAHIEVIDWQDQERLVASFINAHGFASANDRYKNFAVYIAHADDLERRTSRLNNDNPTQVSLQVSHLLRDLSKIKDPLKY